MRASTKSFFLSRSYVDGVGAVHENMPDLYVNLLLVERGARPAFLIQEADYDEDSGVFEEIVDKILDDGGFSVGVLSGRSRQAFVFQKKNRKVSDRILSLREPGDTNRKIGEIIGYPAAHDFPSWKTKGRMLFRWNAMVDGQEVEIMTNVFMDKSLVPKMVDLAESFADCLEDDGISVSYECRKMRDV